MHWIGPWGQPLRKTEMKPIFEPGTPTWVRLMAGHGAASVLVQTLTVAVILMWIVLGIVWAISSPVLGIATVAAAVGSILALTWYALAHSVSGPLWKYEGVPITGRNFTLLESIDGRFRYARRLIDQVPTGISWGDLKVDVDALLWEAAGHAARASALEVEIEQLRYAPAGTPQAALRNELTNRRDEYHHLLRGIQHEADELSRAAGNAAAAAKLALSRTGSLHALEVVAPSARELLARGALSEARARLELLADVWKELDETTLIRQEELPSPEVPRLRRRGQR